MRRQPVDFVPHTTYNIHPYLPTSHSADPSYTEILEEIRVSSGVTVKVSAIDEGPGLSGRAQGLVETREKWDSSGTTLHSVIHTPGGDLWSEKRIPNGQPAMVVKHYVSTDEDLANYMSLPYNPPAINASRIRQVYEAIGDGGVVFVPFSDPMFASASVMDFEDFCIRCAEDPESLQRLIEWNLERSLENVRLLCEACSGMDVILHTSGPEVCTPPMVSPAMFARLVTPYLTKIVDIIHQHGFLAAIHCHGRVREVFPEVLKIGADLLEPIEPPDQGNIALHELMEKAVGRISLMGHVQDQEIYRMSGGEMRRWVEYLLETAAGRTGYIISPTCTPFDSPCTETYRDNYLEYLRTAAALSPQVSAHLDSERMTVDNE